MTREEFAIVLDFLPNGYPLEGKMMPIVQAIGESNLTLLELVPRKDIKLEIGEKVYIGEGKRDKIYYILGRLKREKLTESGKNELEGFINQVVKDKESEFVEFFNKADALNKRMHQIELLPGLGKRYMREILDKRKEKPFESFEDIRNRVSNFPFPEKAVQKRIMQELTNLERYNLFVK